MIKSSLRLHWYFISAFFIILFSYLVNSLESQTEHINSLLKYSSLNGLFFYNFTDSFFLEFDYKNIHPYFLLISLLLKILPLKAIVIFLGICLVGLVYLNSRLRQPGIKESVILLSTVIFAPSENGIFFLLWIQYLFVSLFKKNKELAAVIASFLYLPGFFLIFLTGLVEKFNHRNSLKDLFYLSKKYVPGFLFIAVLNIIMAALIFELNFKNIFDYFFLPFLSQLNKIRVNNLSHSGVFLEYLNGHKTFYGALIYIFFVSFGTEKRDHFFSRALVSGFLFLLFFILLPFSQGFWIIFTAIFLLSGPDHNKASMQKQLYFIAGILIVLLIHFMSLSEKSGLKPSLGGENIIISYKDVHDVKFEAKEIKKIIIVDLKLIPQNARLLLDDTKSGKIEPILNLHTRNFLEKELQYGEKILSDIEKNPGQYTICLRSRIHPETETAPFRRVFYIWNIIKPKNKRIFLF